MSSEARVGRRPPEQATLHSSVCSQSLTTQKWERERVPLDSSKFRSTTAGFIYPLSQ
ncbi:hypothetical protein BDV26DRAFT_275388 [Aspergillus bertholletiae]|uniref:Uncharacterized protein n=1 Tax=Aspergillus bertholletiae TaxID=1226010 RepID=A0A5N7AR31_9EURO|nr:hypothetical protein BDV26DRAFT_275388 [Aspergillus bertholletiae]